MEYYKSTNTNYIYKGILFIQAQLLIDTFFSIMQYSSQLLSLERYIILFIAACFLIRGIYIYAKRPSICALLLLLWVTYITINGFIDVIQLGYNSTQFKQFLSGLFLLNIYPFLITINLPIAFYKKLFKLNYNLAIIEIVLLCIAFLLNSRVSMYEQLTMFASGLGIMLMTMFYHDGKKRKFIIFSVILNILIMVLLIRRNKVLYFGTTLIFALMLNYFAKGIPYHHSRIRSIVMALFSLLLIVLLVFYQDIYNFYIDMQTGFSSRETILNLFIEDFNNSPKDWITGRGMFGSYNGGVLATDEETGLRQGIENGYLQIILKGGWIWLGLLIIISIKAIYLGLFKSNNILCKGMALIILIYYIDMIGFGVPELSMKYLSVFIFIGGCNSKQLRQYTDVELKEQIGLR